MAAADLSRSRAAASRSTKGLLFISTLLCLVCFVSSSIDVDQLDQLEKFIKIFLRFKQDFDQLKEMHMTDSAMIAEMMSDYMDLMDQMLSSPSLKGFDKSLPDGYPSVDALMDYIRTFWKEFKAHMDRDIEKIRRMNTEL